MKTMSLKIDEAMDRWLESEAQRLGRTKSDIAREALDQRRKGANGRPSLHDLAKEACGSIKNGPRDLSRNHRKYLKDLGE
jgi:predicted DNA-binding protein